LTQQYIPRTWIFRYQELLFSVSLVPTVSLIALVPFLHL
jgi:hypothetical protein